MFTPERGLDPTRPGKEKPKYFICAEGTRVKVRPCGLSQALCQKPHHRGEWALAPDVSYDPHHKYFRTEIIHYSSGLRCHIFLLSSLP